MGCTLQAECLWYWSSEAPSSGTVAPAQRLQKLLQFGVHFGATVWDSPYRQPLCKWRPCDLSAELLRLIYSREMPVRIRLAMHGCTNRPFYHIVVASSKFKRNGRHLEQVTDASREGPPTIHLTR